MKQLPKYAFLLLLAFQAVVVFAQTDPVKTARKANEDKADKKLVNEDDAAFLVKSADARMMDMQEGKLASEKGTTPAIRSYGKLMMKDQAMLQQKIKQLAGARYISLPSTMSNKKEDGRESLDEKTGTDFDQKFIKMMKIDHERDVKLFKVATASSDKGISQFATKYLPMIQSHLDKINAIKEDGDK